MAESPGIIDLFSGVGGLSLGAARAGFSVLAAIENDPEAAAAHRINFPEAVHLELDLLSLSSRAILTKVNRRKGDVTGIVGGPPCQGFSAIGKRNSRDPRNRLFGRFFDLIHEISPQFFLAENVPGILEGGNSGTVNRALTAAKKQYVVLPPFRLKASDYGAPTSRERIFFFGYKAKYFKQITLADFAIPKGVAPVNVRKALKGLPGRIHSSWQLEEQSWRKVTYGKRDYFSRRLTAHIPTNVGDSAAIARLRRRNEISGFLGTLHGPRVIRRYRLIPPGKKDSVSRSVRLKWEGFCPTLRAGTKIGRFQAVRPLHPSQDRVISPREAARLQGFPDWFQFSPTKWHSFRQIGNSVSPLLAEHLFQTIYKGMR